MRESWDHESFKWDSSVKPHHRLVRKSRTRRSLRVEKAAGAKVMRHALGIGRLIWLSRRLMGREQCVNLSRIRTRPSTEGLSLIVSMLHGLY